MSYLGRSAKLSLKAQEKVSFLATAGQTSKTGLSYTPSFVEVYVNGVLLTDTTDFTATNGNSITFTVALLLNDEVTVISLKTFTVADHYSKTEADTLRLGTQEFNRTGSDGTIVDLQKDGTSVGSIGVDGSAPYFATSVGSTLVGIKMQGGSVPRVNPTDGNGDSTDGDATLGYASSRFKDLYLSGGVYLGGTGAANKLDDYETGSWTPTAVGGMVSFTTQSAYYTKIGNLVTVNFFIDAFVTKSGSPVSIGGLPFSLFSGSNYSTGAAENGGGESMIARANNNTTNMNFYKTNSTNTTAIGTDLGGRLIATVTYRSA